MATPPPALTKRERQIMDVLYRLGPATAAEILNATPGGTASSTIRTQLRVLEAKGHVRHVEQGLRYVYLPTVPRHTARRSALEHLVDTFFDGSTANLMTTLLGRDATSLSEPELRRIEGLIEAARAGRAEEMRAGRAASLSSEKRRRQDRGDS